MVAEISQDSTACVIALRIRRSEISWEISQNIVECHLIVDNLMIEMDRIERSQVLMGPTM